jgi:hypothetical protein
MADMTAQDKQIVRLIRWNRLWLLVLLLLLLAAVARFYYNSVIKDVYSLHATWGGNTLHVHSAKDGPFVVTHLVKLEEYAVAQLPRPITIIDSRGHYFSKSDIDKLDWIGSQGDKQAPPAVGTDVKAFYFVPLETAPAP